MTRAPKSVSRFPDVPKDQDPIEYLIGVGYAVPTIALMWDVTPDAVYKLRRGSISPKVTTTAQRIALSIGWSLGEVVEHFANRRTV